MNSMLVSRRMLGWLVTLVLTACTAVKTPPEATATSGSPTPRQSVATINATNTSVVASTAVAQPTQTKTPNVHPSVTPTENATTPPVQTTLPTLTPRPPGVQILSPISFAPIRAHTLLYISINAVSPNGLNRLELLVNGTVIASADAKGATEYNLVFGWQTDVNGDYQIQARATDVNGAVQQSSAATQKVRGGLDNAGSGEISAIGSVVLIPEGAFRMGSDDGPVEEKPVHDVHLSPFEIDRFPVTVGQFRAYVASTKYKTSAETANEPITRTWHIDDDPNRWEHPVRFISWFDADYYCRSLEKRLPTEAQWEYAARGTDFRRYPWGNDFDATRVPAGDSSPVGFYPTGVSPFGVFDIAGNVWQWTDDWYDPLYYRSANPVNPRPGKSIDQKSIRGGGFNSPPDDLRVTRRIHNFQATYHADVGFRCVKGLP